MQENSENRRQGSENSEEKQARRKDGRQDREDRRQYGENLPPNREATPPHQAQPPQGEGMVTFQAMLSRMKYIPRWSLMRCSRPESLGEHTAETAQIAHTLCCVNNALFGGSARAEKVAAAALYHDAAEIITGDLPTPVKYRNEAMRTAYRQLETDAQQELLALLPPQLRRAMRPALLGEGLTEEERRLLKAADRLSAIIKCLTEAASGNNEFTSARRQQTAALAAMACPEADWFVQNMLPAYGLTLDELTRHGKEWP